MGQDFPRQFDTTRQTLSLKLARFISFRLLPTVKRLVAVQLLGPTRTLFTTFYTFRATPASPLNSIRKQQYHFLISLRGSRLEFRSIA